MQQYAIIVENLVKTYKEGKIIALDHLSLKVPAGTIYGVLGKNGAGKSTFIKCIIGFLKQDKGSIQICNDGKSLCKNHIGYMPEHTEIYDFMTGMDFLETVADLRGIKHEQMMERLNELSEYIDLPNLDLLTSSYSKGNLEKIIFLTTMIHSPNIVILDEPFTGFDPAASLKAKEYLKKYKESGKTVILSTHILEMAAHICDNIIIIDKGKAKSEYCLGTMGSLEHRLDILKEAFN